MRRGSDKYTIAVRLSEEYMKILSYLIRKYGAGFGLITFSSQFRKMLEGIDRRPFEHNEYSVTDENPASAHSKEDEDDEELPADRLDAGKEEAEFNPEYIDLEI
jgi:hypothetical protein